MRNFTWRQMTNLRLWIPKARSWEMSARCRSQDPPNHKNAPSRNQASGRCRVTLEKNILWLMTFYRYPSQLIKTLIHPDQTSSIWNSSLFGRASQQFFFYSLFAQLGAAFACAISTMPCLVPKCQGLSYCNNCNQLTKHRKSHQQNAHTFTVNIIFVTIEQLGTLWFFWKSIRLVFQRNTFTGNYSLCLRSLDWVFGVEEFWSSFPKQIDHNLYGCFPK